MQCHFFATVLAITHLSSVIATISLAKILFGCKNTAMEDCKASLLCGTHHTIVTYLQFSVNKPHKVTPRTSMQYKCCIMCVCMLYMTFF